MLPFIVGGMAALSVASSVSSNRAIAKTANANATATGQMLKQQRDVSISQGMDKAYEANVATGMALTDLLYQATGAKGTTAVTTTERNITGRTAARQNQIVEMKKALQEDRVIQAGEATIEGIQQELKNAKYAYESGMSQNSINFNNAMAQQQSTLGIIAGAAQSGFSAYTAGKAAGMK